MSAAIALWDDTTFYARRNDTGASDAARNLSNFFKNELVELSNTSIIWGSRNRLAEQLLSIFIECNKPKWDGYDASPITENALLDALLFINVFPTTGLPLPEIVPDPEGNIGFEWDFGKNHVFVVSLKGDGTITYAGLFGPSRTRYGTESFNDSIPKFIIECIRLAEKKN